MKLTPGVGQSGWYCKALMTSCFVRSISSGFPVNDLLESWAVPVVEEEGSRREASGECVVEAAPGWAVALDATGSTTLSDGAGAVMLGRERKEGGGEARGGQTRYLYLRRGRRKKIRGCGTRKG